MSTSTSTKKQSAVFTALMLSLPLILLALLAYYRPFWGIMDDKTNLAIIDDMGREGVMPVLWKLANIDLFEHGRLRSLYFAMVAMIYLPAGESSVTAYSINVVFLSAIFFVSAFAFWHAAKDAYSVSRRHLFLFAFVMLCFAFPWTIHAIRAPSVHEKIVLLFAGFVLLAQYRLTRAPLAAWALVVAFTLAWAVQTKETIALFFPLFLAAQLHLDHSLKSYKRTGLLLLYLLAAAVLIKWAGTHGTYKAAYGMERAMATLTQSRSLYVFLALSAAATITAWLDFHRHRSFTRLLLALSFPAGLALFLVLMLPWGIGGYLNCSATLFVVMCLIGVGKFAFDRVPALRAAPMPALAGTAYAAAIATVFFGMNSDYSAYSDFRRVIFSEGIAQAAREGRTLWMPCNEGASTMEVYLLRFRGITLPTRIPDPVGSMGPGEYWVTSPGKCSDGQDVSSWVAKGEAEMVVAPSRPSGFSLVRRLRAP